MARTDQQFPLRLPPELKEKLENACKESGRSKNAEAVYRLERTFEIDFFRVTLFGDLKEPAASIEIGAITIGLYESQYKEIELYEMGINSWIFSYHAVRCYLRDDAAQQLLKLGCTYKGSSIHKQ